MKTVVYMMADADGELAARLASLSGGDARCCLDRLSRLEGTVAEEVEFDAVLDRHAALADRRRLMVAAMLARTEELCACEIQASLGVTHATVSHHMSTLVDAGLVESDKRGRWVYYRLAEGAERWVP